MKQFNKDQIQKMVLSGILFCILIYGYFSFLLGPLSRNDTANANAIVDLQTKVDGAKRQMRLSKNAEERSTTAMATIASIETMIPKEAAIAWMPPLVSNFFNQQGIPKATLQLQGTESVGSVGLEKFKFFNWELSLPAASFLTSAAALSQFENEMPLAAFVSVRVDTTPSAPEEQHMVCIVKTLLK